MINNHISPREKEVLHLIGREMTINEIAKTLYISHHTVISHRKNLMEKLEARNTAGMMVKAFERGIFKLDSAAISMSYGMACEA